MIAPRRHSVRRAFTLVEALVVVAVVGTILPVAMYGISLCAGAATLVRQRAAAVELAHEKLSESLLYQSWRNGDTSGDSGDTVPVYHWALHVTDWSDASGSSTNVSLRELTVEVTWLHRNQPRSVTLATLVYDSEGATP